MSKEKEEGFGGFKKGFLLPKEERKQTTDTSKGKAKAKKTADSQQTQHNGDTGATSREKPTNPWQNDPKFKEAGYKIVKDKSAQKVGKLALEGGLSISLSNPVISFDIAGEKIIVVAKGLLMPSENADIDIKVGKQDMVDPFAVAHFALMNFIMTKGVVIVNDKDYVAESTQGSSSAESFGTLLQQNAGNITDLEKEGHKIVFDVFKDTSAPDYRNDPMFTHAKFEIVPGNYVPTLINSKHPVSREPMQITHPMICFKIASEEVIVVAKGFFVDASKARMDIEVLAQEQNIDLFEKAHGVLVGCIKLGVTLFQDKALVEEAPMLEDAMGNLSVEDPAVTYMGEDTDSSHGDDA